MLELHNKQIVCKTSFSRSLLTQNSERNVAVFSTLVTGGGSVGECGRLRVNPGGFWPHYNILLYLLTYLPSLRHFVLLRGTLSCYPMHVTLLKFWGVLDKPESSQDALANPVGHTPSNVRQDSFVPQKTDFWTNWPTSQFVKTENAFSFSMASPLTTWPGALPWDATGGYALRFPLCRFAVRK